ncbi:MAG: hypothetical protein K5798_01930 [Nitrosopumilus sp.]|uniref:hypothetical protein n=1 Tax=Nitrosopumilus sp. TaxID=2024843 RepID=UPI002431BC97|nr:hypothetical protein [Nitrosopumilus sp.]MCV0366008.1 hypothetical protein [Nitrosopumilus sp.]
MISSSNIYTVKTLLVIIIILGITSATYVFFMFVDNQTEITDTNLHLSDNQKRVQANVERAIERFNEKIDTEINLEDMAYFAGNEEPFVFIIHYKKLWLLAHPNPDLIQSQDYALLMADKPFEVIIDELDKNQHIWIYFDELNPDTGKIEKKHVWLKKHFGYVFGSGYFVNGNNK